MESGKRPLSPKLHLHVDKEVPWTFNLSMQVHSTRVGIQLPGAEVVLLISLCDADYNVVSRVCRGGSNAEDLSRDDDVGLEAEVVVGDSQWRALTLQVVRTADPLTAPTRDTGKARQGQATLFVYHCTLHRVCITIKQNKVKKQ